MPILGNCGDKREAETLSRDLGVSCKLCATLRERRRSRGELAECLAGPATSGEALRRYRVGRTTPRVDFRSAGCLIHLLRGSSRELSGDPGAVDATTLGSWKE